MDVLDKWRRAEGLFIHLVLLASESRCYCCLSGHKASACGGALASGTVSFLPVSSAHPQFSPKHHVPEGDLGPCRLS